MNQNKSRELSARVVLVGAGPVGIEVAAGLKRAGIDYSADGKRSDSLDYLPLAAACPVFQFPREGGHCGDPLQFAPPGAACPETLPCRITEEGVELSRSDGSTLFVPADFVLLATGYHADLSLFKDLEIPLNGEGVPLYDPQTMESAVPGARQGYKDFYREQSSPRHRNCPGPGRRRNSCGDHSLPAL